MIINKSWYVIRVLPKMYRIARNRYKGDYIVDVVHKRSVFGSKEEAQAEADQLNERMSRRGHKRTFDYDEVWKYIIEYKRSNDGLAPGFRQIMEVFGIKTTSHVFAILHALEREGKIILGNDENNRRTTRDIRIPGGQWTYGGK